MDGSQNSVSRSQLYVSLGGTAAPIVLDVRREADLEFPNRIIASAARRSPEGVEKTAAALRAIGYASVYLDGGIADWVRQGDIEGVEFAHEGDRCSLDTIIRIYEIADAPRDHMQGADTSRRDLSSQCGGLFAISLGVSANFSNDREVLAYGTVTTRSTPAAGRCNQKLITGRQRRRP